MAAAQARPRAAYCTLITSDSFLPGLQVMAFSLRASGTKVPLVILHTSALSDHSINKLKALPGCALRAVEDIPNPNADVHVEGWVNSGYAKALSNHTYFHCPCCVSCNRSRPCDV